MRNLKGYVRNHTRPESCIAECYIAEEAVEFCADYLSNVHTIGIPASNYKIDMTRPIGGSQVQAITQEKWEQAHLHVLTNDDKIDAYIK